MPFNLESRRCSHARAVGIHGSGAGSAGSGGSFGATEIGRTADGQRGPIRVLVVDDNVALAENIAEILQNEGYATEVAASAEEALAKALAGRMAVLITDFRLPGMNGAELVRRLRQEWGQIHAVVISAYSDEHTIDDARDAGAEFMPKPVDFAALNRFVRMREGST